MAIAKKKTTVCIGYKPVKSLDNRDAFFGVYLSVRLLDELADVGPQLFYANWSA